MEFFVKNNMSEKQAKSYDLRMETMPLLVSYPRSGSNWLNCVLELYFDRPRLRNGPVSFLENKKNRTDFMWFHDHDIFSNLKINHNNIIYLYRNPTNVIFSLLMAEHQQSFNTNELNNLIKIQIERLKNNLTKYLVINSCTHVKYEMLKGSLYYNEFEKILKFFKINKPLNKKKLDDILNKVKKNEIVKKEPDKNYFNDKMLSDDYRKMRVNFSRRFDELIFLQIACGDLAKFFEDDVI